MRVAMYLRVSTDEQASSGAGLAAQRRAIEAEVERRGWSISEIHEDAGYSAKDLRRPAVQAALTDLREGRADALVVAKLDRLSRSLLDFAGLMATAQKENWSLVALDVAVDTSTPAGEAMASILATFAQFERRLIGQRTRDALAIKRAQGVRLGRPPSISADVVARIRKDHALGVTASEISRRLNDERIPTSRGGLRWWPSTVTAVVKGAREPAAR